MNFADQINGVEDDSSFDLALQGILGLDYYLNQDWGVFAEYKYFIHYEPELFGTSPENEQEFHLLGFGVKRRL
ncbi:MAG: hypothetical protein HC901_01440 [Bdellovibrionaceae bacterium]|nr:hypothetical protein [Pseudobdellovibrionaceae bacterium]